MIFSKSCFPLILILFLNLKKSCVLQDFKFQVVSLVLLNLFGIMTEQNFEEWYQSEKRIYTIFFPQLPSRLVSPNCTICFEFGLCVCENKRAKWYVAVSCFKLVRVPNSNPSKLHSNRRYENGVFEYQSLGSWAYLRNGYLAQCPFFWC